MILEKLYFPFISSIIAKTLIQAKTTQFDCTNKTKYKSKHQNILEGYFVVFFYFSTDMSVEDGGCVADFLISCLSPGTDCCKLKVSVSQLGSIILRFAPTSHQQWSRQRQNKCSLMRLSRVACRVTTDDWTDQMALSLPLLKTTLPKIFTLLGTILFLPVQIFPINKISRSFSLLVNYQTPQRWWYTSDFIVQQNGHCIYGL